MVRTSRPKALRGGKIHEATKVSSLFLGVRRRECQTRNCDGRYSGGQIFGRGFDSRQVHKREAFCLPFLLAGIERRGRSSKNDGRKRASDTFSPKPGLKGAQGAGGIPARSIRGCEKSPEITKEENNHIL